MFCKLGSENTELNAKFSIKIAIFDITNHGSAHSTSIFFFYFLSSASTSTCSYNTLSMLLKFGTKITSNGRKMLLVAVGYVNGFDKVLPSRLFPAKTYLLKVHNKTTIKRREIWLTPELCQ